MERVRNRIDYELLIYFAGLLCFGLLALSSASVAIGMRKFGSPYYFLNHQLIYGVAPGLVLFFVFLKIDTERLKRWKNSIYFLTLLLLTMVFIPGVGASYGMGARSWVNLFGLSFQPGEIAKLTLVIFLAAYLAEIGNKLLDFKNGFLPALGLGALPILLDAAQPDTGTAAILFAITLGLLFFARARLTHLSLLLVAGALGLLVLVLIAPYRMNRLTTFLHPELDPQGKGYQINQAFMAIGSGGFFGLGLGQSRQKFEYLPEVQADSIYAIISEEMGFLFSAALIILILLIVRRCLRLAKKNNDRFSQLLICGISVWFFGQSVLNIGAIIGLLPLTGVPLPFVSHGGTALMVNMAAVGLLLNLSARGDS
ncbi:MAG: putative lipid II flippase FtsW [Patescibacteria group bacterium]